MENGKIDLPMKLGSKCAFRYTVWVDKKAGDVLERLKRKDVLISEVFRIALNEYIEKRNLWEGGNE